MNARMISELVSQPQFRAETDRLLRLLGDSQQIGSTLTDPYSELLADRLLEPDPAIAGLCDPATRPDNVTLDLPGRTLEGRLYMPLVDEPRPVLMWLHGGGFVGGHLRDIEATTSGIARVAEVVVLSLNYRLAPEHPFPAALQDTVDAIVWIHRNYRDIGGNGSVAVGGQSAGAALAAGACLEIRGAPFSGARPGAQVLCYPNLDLGHETESSRLFNGVFHTLDSSSWADRQYFPAGELPASAVPLRASDLGDLPPALVLAAGRDPLRDDARAYAARLAQAGVRTRLVEYADTMHAMLNFPAALSAGRHAIDLIGRHLRTELR